MTGDALKEERIKVLKDEPKQVDPTANVLSLVEAATKRSDDLREVTIKYLDSQIAHLKEIGDLRAKHSCFVDQLRAEHLKENAATESNRVNAIRQVDVLAVNTAADRASAQALVLANQVVTSAETLRSLVATTAQTVAASQAQLATNLTERISLVEKAQYESKGKSLMADPQIIDLIAEVRGLKGSTSTGIGLSWGVVTGIISIIIGLIAIFTFINRQPQVQQAPIIVESIPISDKSTK